MNDFRLYAALQELQNCTAQYSNGEARTAEIRKIMDLIATQQYHVAVIGEFNRGKSSLINALLGTRILPTDILPMTAAVTKLRYGVSQQIRILFRDGTEQACTLEALERYATKRTADSERQAAAVREIEISWPSVFLQNHIELTDTPGLNESERMAELTMQAIGDVDAAIVVFSPDSPLSLTEQGLILDLLRQPGIRHLVFVMNMLDRVRTEQRKDRLLENIRTRLQQELLPRALADGCIDPDKAHRILDSPAVFGVSALQALEGFSRDDPEMVDASRFPDFKTQLLALLTAARGMDPQARGKAAAAAVCRELPAWQEAEQAALCAEIQSLEAQLAAGRQPSAETALPPAACSQLRTQAGLTENGLDLEQQLLPDVEGAYAGVEQSLLEYVDTVEITSEEMKNDKKAQARAEAISQELKSRAEKQLNAATQALLSKMQTRVGEDLALLENAGNEIFTDMVQVQEKLLTGGSDNRDKAMEMGLAAASLVLTNSTPLFGLGAMYNGWKEQGLPGALVGGGVGLAAGAAAAYGTAAIAGTLLGITTFVGLATIPFLAIGGLASTIAGKTAVNTIFKKRDKQIRQLREQLRSYVADIMQAVRKDRVLEHWLRDTCGGVYEAISEKLDGEVEATLVNFERQLVQLQADRDRQSGEMDTILQTMDTLEQELREILTRMQPVQKKLQAALAAPAA